MPGYKRTKLGQLNRLVALKNKNKSKGYSKSSDVSKSTSCMQFSRKLESLLGQATCISFSESHIQSVLNTVDVMKDNYLRLQRQCNDVYQKQNVDVQPYLSGDKQAVPELSSLSESQVIPLCLPLLEGQTKPYSPRNDENHCHLVEYDISDDDTPETDCILTIFTATVVLTLYLLLRRRVDFSLCNKSFHGFNVLITGGSSGIGLSLAKLFYKAGANVTIVARDLAKLECAREAIRREKNGNNSVFILSVDLTSNYEVLSEVFSKHVTAHGKIC
ncbi:unnamed protein product, partial [Trichobilharzia regenti]